MEGAAALGSAIGGSDPFVLLEDRVSLDPSGWLYAEPAAVIECTAADDLDEALASLDAGLREGLHVAGFLSYELGRLLEPRLSVKLAAPTSPLFCMGLFPPPERICGRALDEVFAGRAPAPPIKDLKPTHSRTRHCAKVARVLQLISAGDIYQANLTFRIDFRYAGEASALYAALRVRQPTGHSALVQFAGLRLLSVSPELFVRVREGRATSRPMKGTIARSSDPEADRHAAERLCCDPKQRAENIMIVDLIRNDLARISRAGTVKVPALLTLESYPDLHTLTSTVTAELKPGASRLQDRLTALFPCGSIVGAPKIRAGEILAELEDHPRGAYTGAIGACAPNGDMEFNVAIRTVVGIGGDHYSFGVGGGVVADSDPDGEYDEALLKARLLEDLAREFDLIETLRWSAEDGYIRLPLHLDRLERSAGTLGFWFDREGAAAALEERGTAFLKVGAADRRVRLRLTRGGRLHIRDASAPAPASKPLRVGIAMSRLDAGSPLTRHKTSLRTLYEACGVEAEARGWDEALLLNRYGEVADGARRSLFVAVDGRLTTPPLAAGALPGVLRRQLLDAGEAVERALSPAMLREADTLFVGNSLRGLESAVLVD